MDRQESPGRSQLPGGRSWPRRSEAAGPGAAAPEVIDGVIQGSSVRLVIKKEAPPPTVNELGAGAEVKPTPPRFEDAFVDLLGGGPKGESPLAGEPDKDGADGTAVVEAEGLTKKFGDFTAADRRRPARPAWPG
jgi:ABC-2 type transport system ATP-binding protein